MIGNDIIDLKLAKKQSNYRRAGFLDKQFSSSEQVTNSINIKYFSFDLEIMEHERSCIQIIYSTK